uniref:Uncharacterized protein n=1 Tax=Lotus japonicus TaxID=34305 RepID=I3T0T1_LOTJA|nr:unknown [Lotus japonicus]
MAMFFSDVIFYSDNVFLSSTAPVFHVERLIFFEQKKIPAQISLFISYKLVSLQSPKLYVRRPRIVIHLQVSMQSSLIRSKEWERERSKPGGTTPIEEDEEEEEKEEEKEKDDSKK